MTYAMQEFINNWIIYVKTGLSWPTYTRKRKREYEIDEKQTVKKVKFEEPLKAPPIEVIMDTTKETKEKAIKDTTKETKEKAIEDTTKETKEKAIMDTTKETKERAIMDKPDDEDWTTEVHRTMEAIYRELFNVYPGDTPFVPEVKTQRTHIDLGASLDARLLALKVRENGEGVISDLSVSTQASGINMHFWQVATVIRGTLLIENILNYEHDYNMPQNIRNYEHDNMPHSEWGQKAESFQRNFSLDRRLAAWLNVCQKYIKESCRHPRLRQIAYGDLYHKVSKTFKRYHQIQRRLGWKFLSICGFSCTFMSKADNACDEEWKSLFDCLCENFSSIILVGAYNIPMLEPTIRAIQHSLMGESEVQVKENRNDRFKYAVVLPPKDRADMPYTELISMVPPYIYQTSRTRMPGSTFEDKRLYDKEYSRENRCCVCNEKRCTCEFEDWYPRRVELIDTKYRNQIGIAVRALQTFKKGDIIGEYIGEYYSPSDPRLEYYNDWYQVLAYPIRHTITAMKRGNWLRFVAHSCHPNTFIASINWHGKWRMVYRCYKDIAMFEEITVSYGWQYVKEMGNCRCGADVHENEENFTASPTQAEMHKWRDATVVVD